jgi:hypothetical protein
MEETAVWFVGACITSWSIGFCGGIVMRAIVQIFEKATAE